MKRRLLKLILFMCVCMVPFPIWAAEERPDKDYIIGPGDVIEITVRQDPKMTRSIAVLPDGKISLPMVGQVMAGGKTLDELKKDLEREIAAFIPDPFVTVGVSDVNSMVIYVLGKVNTPGPISLTGPVNVLQAIALAGGLADFAKENSIKIFREEGETKKVLKFKYGDVAKGKNLEQNIRLKRGDVIVVP